MAGRLRARSASTVPGAGPQQPRLRTGPALLLLAAAGACLLAAAWWPQHRENLQLAAALLAVLAPTAFAWAYLRCARASCARCSKPFHARVLRGERMRLSRACDHCGWSGS